MRYPSSAMGCLMHEHRVIERVIPVLDEMAVAIRANHGHRPGRLEVAADFIRTYADRCHHGKEEDILFRELARRSLEPEHASMMDDLVREHVHARETTRRLVEANRRFADGFRDALPAIADELEALVAFYPVHIRKEDREFFPACLKYLSAEELRSLHRAFVDFDRTLIHERYAAVADSLREIED